MGPPERLVGRGFGGARRCNGLYLRRLGGGKAALRAAPMDPRESVERQRQADPLH